MELNNKQFIGIVGHELLSKVNEHVQQAKALQDLVPIKEINLDDDYSDDSVQNPNAFRYHLLMAGANKNRAISFHNTEKYERAALSLEDIHNNLFEAARAFDREQKDKEKREINTIWPSVGEVGRILEDYRNLIRTEPPKGIDG